MDNIARRIEADASAMAATSAFEELVDRAPFGLFIVDADLRILRVSDGARTTFDWSQPVLDANLEQALQRIWPVAEITNFVKKCRQTLVTGAPYFSRTFGPRKDSLVTESYEWHVHCLTLPDGGTGLACHFYDLSDQVNRETALEMHQQHANRTARELQLILDNSIAFVGLLDPDGTLREANAPALTAGGLKRSDVIGAKFWDAPWWSYDADAAAKLKAAIERANAGEVVRYDTDVRMRENRIMTIDFLLSPIRDASGRVIRLIASGFDITERLKAEDHVRLLMAEVNHRSKNVLTLVQSIARMTHRSDPDNFMQTFEARLGGLARSYDMLLSHQTAGIDILGLVRSQLAHFEDLIGSRILLSGPAIRLTSDTAQTMGMAIHELATNAGKYGALSNGSGQIHVDWQAIRTATDDPGFEITWAEKGGPPVEPPLRTGFGSTVLGPIAQSTFQGVVNLQHDPQGVVWHAISGSDCVID